MPDSQRSYRRKHEPRRRGRRAGHWRRDFGAIVLFLAVSGVVAVAQLVEHLLPLVLIAGAGWGGWRLWRHYGTARRETLRRQIRKLEDQAAEHDGLVERIERVTRRPVELHIADLERAQGQYRRQP